MKKISGPALKNICGTLILAAVFGLVIVLYGCGAMPPTITSLTVSPSTVVVQGTATLDCTAADPNGKTLTYTWSANGGTLSSSSGNRVFWTAPATPGTYVVNVTISNGTMSTSSSISIVVTLANIPIIQHLLPASSTVNIGSSTAITCEATDPNGLALTYTWKASGGTLSSSSGQTVLWTAPSTPGTYTITVTVSDTLATVSFDSQITVSTPPTITSLTVLPPSLTAISGAHSVLTCEATDPGGNTLTYTWSANGGSLSTSIGKTTIWTAPSTAGTYTVTITVSNGLLSTSATSNISVTVAAAPSINTLSATPTSGTSGFTSSLYCSATDPYGQLLTYSWSATGGALSTSVGQNTTWTAPTVATQTVYKVTVTVSNGTTSASGDVNLTVNP